MMKSTKKGSITVEAAIILPMFIIAVLTISYTIKLIEAEECVINGVADEARHVAAYAYIEKTGLGVKPRIEKRIKCACDASVKCESNDRKHYCFLKIAVLYSFRTGK